MNELTITIGIVNFNKAKFVNLAINSAISQDTKANQIIVIDNASTDNSAEVIQKTIKGTSVEYIKNPTNIGVAAAKNQIAEKCTSEYLLYLDGDDLLYSTAISKFAAVIKDYPEASCIYSDYDIFDMASNRTIREISHPYSFQLLCNLPYIHSNSCFKLADLKSTGKFNEKIWGGENYELCLRMAKNHLMLQIPQSLFSYRIHSDNFHRNNHQLVMTNINKIRQDILS